MNIELIECKPYRARLTERACKLRQERARKLSARAKSNNLHPFERQTFEGMEACLGECERAKVRG